MPDVRPPTLDEMRREIEDAMERTAKARLDFLRSVGRGDLFSRAVRDYIAGQRQAVRLARRERRREIEDRQPWLF